MDTVNSTETGKKMMERLQKLMEITGSHICLHCLGRRFADSMEGPGNLLRGMKLREEFSLSTESPCAVCGDIFERIDDAVEAARSRIDALDLEYSSILVGTRLPDEVVEGDEHINRKLGIQAEGIKKELNREIGKRLADELGCRADFQNPDLVVMVDFRAGLKVWIQINPIFIEGRYRKLVRGIPQTKWPCRRCRGRGCEACNHTGKMYSTSVLKYWSPEPEIWTLKPWRMR